MAERRTGAGARLGSVLERSAPPEPPAVGPEARGAAEPTPAGGGGVQPKRARSARIKGRTIYLHDALFERILVQAHRRGVTISDYVAGVLDRQVPDHRARAVRAEPATAVEPVDG